MIFNINSTRGHAGSLLVIIKGLSAIIACGVKRDYNHLDVSEIIWLHG